jgi:hypothetical protein
MAVWMTHLYDGQGQAQQERANMAEQLEGIAKANRTLNVKLTALGVSVEATASRAKADAQEELMKQAVRRLTDAALRLFHNTAGNPCDPATGRIQNSPGADNALWKAVADESTATERKWKQTLIGYIAADANLTNEAQVVRDDVFSKLIRTITNWRSKLKIEVHQVLTRSGALYPVLCAMKNFDRRLVDWSNSELSDGAEFTFWILGTKHSIKFLEAEEHAFQALGEAFEEEIYATVLDIKSLEMRKIHDKHFKNPERVCDKNGADEMCSMRAITLLWDAVFQVQWMKDQADGDIGDDCFEF